MSARSYPLLQIKVCLIELVLGFWVSLFQTGQLYVAAGSLTMYADSGGSGGGLLALVLMPVPTPAPVLVVLLSRLPAPRLFPLISAMFLRTASSLLLPRTWLVAAIEGDFCRSCQLRSALS